MKKLLPAVILCAVCASPIFASDLNAPVERPAVTVASEVDRGMSACPDFSRLDVLNYMDAVFRVENESKQKNTHTKPFQFGLYYLAWHRVWSGLNFDLPREKTARNLAIADVAIMFTVTQSLQKQLGLDRDDVQKLAGVYYEPDEETRFAELLKSKRFKGSMLTTEEKSKQVLEQAAKK